MLSNNQNAGQNSKMKSKGTSEVGPANVNMMIARLKQYFSKRDDVVMAFLYGSWAKGQEGIDSDVDIAIYFEPRGRIFEWEDLNVHYDSENRIWLDVESIVEREVGLLILNRAAPTIADSALRGMPIIIKNRNLYMNFLLRITSEAIDMREWIEGYWKFKQERRYGATARR